MQSINDVTGLISTDLDNRDDLFAFKISYNAPTDSGKALFNGNISETYWRTMYDDQVRKYEYTYDHLNRLLQADYSRPDNMSIKNAYKEVLTYDKNGNILTLGRNGLYEGDDYDLEIDKLVYAYHPSNKNQLAKVTDTTGWNEGFNEAMDTDSSNDDYQYDANGNMTRDDNKGITNISYNHLNLPVTITFFNTVNKNTKIEYLYDATGAKKAKKVHYYETYYTPGGGGGEGMRGAAPTNTNSLTGGATHTQAMDQTDYLAGGYQYKYGVLEFVPHAEGFVKWVEGSPQYYFNYTDHLGNVRVTYYDKGDGPIIAEESNYYPFGLQHKGYNEPEQFERNWGNVTTYASSLNNKYKYNGKELQDELGLNMYDYGARNYDPALGRWMNIDPLTETSRRWNPYTYCYDNPMRFVDPDGMQADDWRINYVDKNGKQQEFIFNGGQTALPDNQFVRDFVDAYRYNVGNGGGDGLRSVAENPNLMVDVQQTYGVSFTDQPSLAPNSGDYNVVNWNPNMGLETTSGNILSPATVLDHEGDHAGKYAAEGKVKMNLRLDKEDAKYDNKEEKRVVTGSEQRTARANGEIAGPEVTRNNHQGLPVITSSPTSTKVNASKTVQFNQKMADQGIFYNPSFEKYKKR